MNLEDYEDKLYLGGCLWWESPSLIHDIIYIYPSPHPCLTATFLIENCLIDIVIFPDFFGALCSNSPVTSHQISYKINLWYFTIPLWMELFKIARNVKTLLPSSPHRFSLSLSSKRSMKISLQRAGETQAVSKFEFSTWVPAFQRYSVMSLTLMSTKDLVFTT